MTETSGSDPVGRGRGVSGASRLAGILAIIVLTVLAAAVVVAVTLRVATGDDQLSACRAVAVADHVLPSVVTVETRTSQGSGNGSGQVIRSGGYILTNYHVIASVVDGGQIVVRYADGATSEATIVGIDPWTDLAVIKAADDAEGRPTIALGVSSDLRVGQGVVALGAPLGLTSTVTVGVISALDRYVPLPLGDGQTAHLIDALQTDASINPGNSGGALVTCDGSLVGINTAIRTVPNSAGQAGGGSVGLGFAIPVDFAIPVADQLIATGRANHPTFGLQAVPLTNPTASDAGVPAGLFVTVADAGGPAEAAGIRPGDILTAIEGQPLRSVAILEKATLTRQAGDTVSLTFWRSDVGPTTVTITLGAEAFVEP
jgi:putative serine protease PepD